MGIFKKKPVHPSARPEGRPRAEDYETLDEHPSASAANQELAEITALDGSGPNCLSTQTIIDIATDPDLATDAVKEHVRTCKDCRELLEAHGVSLV